VALNDDQLAGILQSCVDFAKGIIENMGGFAPFGGRVTPSGELEFFASEISPDAPTLEALYYKAEEILIGQARLDQILAASITIDVTVPDAIESPLRKAIGVFLETPEYCRFVYATYQVSPDAARPGKYVVEQGEMFGVEGKPTIFA
jgi:hypothetical protein